jgi:hypothetical protein
VNQEVHARSWKRVEAKFLRGPDIGHFLWRRRRRLVYAIRFTGVVISWQQALQGPSPIRQLLTAMAGTSFCPCEYSFFDAMGPCSGQNQTHHLLAGETGETIYGS